MRWASGSTSRSAAAIRSSSPATSRSGVEERTLIEDFTATIQRGEVVGFVGPNGSGKSTFLRALMGEREISSGELASVDRFSPATTGRTWRRCRWTVRSMTSSAICGRNGNGVRCKAILPGSDFPATRRNVAPRHCPGDERARVALAMMVLGRANFLVLDEPTNHLDIESSRHSRMRSIEYEGTVLLVSHDRAMLRGAHLAGVGAP